MSLPEQGVNGLFLTTTPIRYGGHQDSHATGFFVVYEGDPFLVTNKHVVHQRTINDNPLRQVRILTRPNPNNVTETETRTIKLLDQDGDRTWFEHPEKVVDLAVIPLNKPIIDKEIHVLELGRSGSGDTGSLGFTASERESHLFTIHEEIPAGTQSIILGYPLFVQNNNFPIARDALIASPYGQTFQDMPAFATDAQTNQGLSGSPIISLNLRDGRLFDVGGTTIEEAKNLTNELDWKLIGIHSEEADITSSLGLGVGWYAELLYDIFEIA